MDYWERTWTERSDTLKCAFGDTYPPDTVVSFSWRDRIRCPGACALPLPPVEESRDPIRHRRDDWLYLTMGLSQPLDQKQVNAERKAGKSYSSHGIELGFVVPSQSDWPADVLYGLITDITDGKGIQWGDCMAFGFGRNTNGEIVPHTGYAHELGFEAVGSIRALLFWRYLFPDWTFTTSVGTFMILVGTGISKRELQAARETTTAHLMLLLCRSGVAQRTLINRDCLFGTPQWLDEWRDIEKLTPEECDREIEAGAGRWQLAKPVGIKQ